MTLIHSNFCSLCSLVCQRLKTFPMDGSVYGNRASSAPPQARPAEAVAAAVAATEEMPKVAAEAPTPRPGSVEPASSRNTPFRLGLGEEVTPHPTTPAWIITRWTEALCHAFRMLHSPSAAAAVVTSASPPSSQCGGGGRGRTLEQSSPFSFLYDALLIITLTFSFRFYLFFSAIFIFHFRSFICCSLWLFIIISFSFFSLGFKIFLFVSFIRFFISAFPHSLLFLFDIYINTRSILIIRDTVTNITLNNRMNVIWLIA